MPASSGFVTSLERWVHATNSPAAAATSAASDAMARKRRERSTAGERYGCGKVPRVRYLVTGSAGFIGSPPPRAPPPHRDEGVRVDSFDDYYDPRRKEENAQGLDVVRLDLAAEQLDELLGGAAGVFHLAGQPGVRSFGDVFDRYVRNNLLASRRVFEAAAGAGVRVAFA